VTYTVISRPQAEKEARAFADAIDETLQRIASNPSALKPSLDG
jgi:hypothetical protein